MFFTYSIESDRDLGEFIIPTGFTHVRGVNGSVGSARTERVDEHNYIGIETITPFFEKEREKVKVRWQIDSIFTEDGDVDGNWRFAFSLDAIEGEEIPVNKTIEEDGVEVTVNKFTVTPLSFNVFFEQKASAAIVEQWDDMSIELSIKDDLGNEYESITGGGSGATEYFHMAWLQTFGKIDPNATKLIITPEVYLWNRNGQNHGSIEVESTTTSVIAEVGGVETDNTDTDSETRILVAIIVELN